jgi:hypothetical protein
MPEPFPPQPTDEVHNTPVVQRNLRGCIIPAGMLAAGMVLAALIVAGAIRETGNRVDRTVQGIQPGNVVASLVAPQTPTIIVRPPAIRQVRAVADLTTVSTLMSTVVDVQQARVGNTHPVSNARASI